MSIHICMHAYMHTYMVQILNVLGLYEVTWHFKYLHSEVLDAQLKLLSGSVDPEFGERILELHLTSISDFFETIPCRKGVTVCWWWPTTLTLALCDSLSTWRQSGGCLRFQASLLYRVSTRRARAT